MATPDDCLDAAFVRVGLCAPDLLRRTIAGTAPVARPFADEVWFALLARWLGCRFAACLPPLLERRLASTLAEPDRRVAPVRSESGIAIVLAPLPDWLPALGKMALVRPDLMARVLIAPPCELERLGVGGVIATAGRLEPIHAIGHTMVADRVALGGQQMAAGLGAAALLAAGMFAPGATGLGVLAALNLALVAHAGTRSAAVVDPKPETTALPPVWPTIAGLALPIYSILVPLYRETDSVPGLVAALRRLDYPADRLDIQFLVETDDAATAAALGREAAGLSATITTVPAGDPRTKPKALNVGLRRARGAFVTIFDAEDRPEPDQLRGAVRAFAEAGADCGALQARLVIDHAGDNWLTRMFALEYATLFDGILPMLARHKRLFLLGGTSNHFRRDVLLAVGGWDPFNVTEDADLAVRLRRAGYRLGVLDSVTWEEAPLTLGAWLKQRTRWQKGWLQTWLVHMRRPGRLLAELGAADFVLFQALVLGAFATALAHPALVVVAGLAAAGLVSIGPPPGALGAVLFAVSALVFVTGYGAAGWLGVRCLKRRPGGVPPWMPVWLPVYWCLTALALVLAIVDLGHRPHHWAKTAHGLARRPED